MAGDIEWDVNAWVSDAMKSDEMKNLLVDLANDVIADTERLTPVKTGLLKASWFRISPTLRSNPYMSGDITWTVGIRNDAFYSSYVEFGTRYMDARAMLHKGADMNNVIWPADQEPYVPPRVNRNNTRRRR